MSDLIDRQSAIDALKGLPTWWADEGGYYGGAQPPMVALLDPEDAVSAIENLPSAQPEPCLDSIVSEIKKTISETQENGKYHCVDIRINGEMICFGLQLALEIIEEKRNGQSDNQTGGD